MKKKKGDLKRIDNLIEELSEKLDSIPLPGGEQWAINVADQIDTLKRARYLLKTYKP